MSVALFPGAALADGLASHPSLNLLGTTGLIDMPSAEMQKDGVLNVSVGNFGPITRTTLSFQITPRLSGSFRYSAWAHWSPNSSPTTYFDRSFDLRYQLLSEGHYRPAVTVGFQDFVGTGLMSAEYLVATKSVTPRLKFTAGLGWGRLGSFGSIATTFGPRPAIDVGKGGTPSIHQFFHGPVAPFGGVEWQISDKLRLKAEYSSDAYEQEADVHHLFHRRIPINAGLEYDLGQTTRLGIYELYGSRIGFSLQFTLDPSNSPAGPVRSPGPVPVRVRPSPKQDPASWSPSWVTEPTTLTVLRDNTATLLAREGLKLETLQLTGTTAVLRFRNSTFSSGAEAIGRAARALSQTLPNSVEVFRIVPVIDGLPLATVTIKRSDLEKLEFAPDNAGKLRARVSLAPVAPLAAPVLRAKNLYPHLSWSIGPYLRTAFFDPNDPLRADLGVRLSAAVNLAPGLVAYGSITKRVFGNLSTSDRTSNSILPHVRSDYDLYDKHGDPALERLAMAYYDRLGPNLFGRISAGYFERMFGGVSGEVLWARPASRFALGAELDYARQRDYNIGLGFLNYGVVTGFLSAYYQFDHGYSAQLDVGRYLAGDKGATLTLAREFPNGWKVGAFATLTNVSFKDFGEGSFDKGIFLSIPVSWMLGQPSTTSISTVLRPIQRDGGAQLDVPGRLYGVVRAYRSGDLNSQWGRVFQ
ncbi:YjbH domain-containing protein [Solirhodobacter olei]|uniref:YjbH domain-containing protein n=1 Tax=Solirhodobacter olei TaxID=2493082 RepID=UPI000FD7CEDD|nr:YjbH domain-containing protein [Solirhodobacter olei]